MYFHQHKKNNTRGLSLIETLIAISILLIAIVGPMTIAARSLQTAIFAREQTAAFYLAQEGIELTLQYREQEALNEIFGSGDGDYWDWRPNVCTNTIACSFDRLGNEERCTTGDCLLYSDAGEDVKYVHDSGGNTATPYTREITIDMSVANVAEVTSVVSWTSPLFNVTTAVTAETFVYNIYDPS